MRPEGALIELLARVGAQNGGPIVISEHELRGWPAGPVTAMKKAGLLEKTRPASSALCPGCERYCVMPVHVLMNPGRDPQAFILCDKRTDINRVAVPVDGLEQWQASGDSIANVLADLLDLQRPSIGNSSKGRREIGVLRGAKHSCHLVLCAGEKLSLTLAGHSIPLTEVLALIDNDLKVDKSRLIRLVDHPVAGAGDIESAEQRRDRIKKRINELKSKGVKAFLKTVAEEEGLSTSRIKQLIQDYNPTPKPKSSYW